jgi:excinuclease ABC subunit C
VSGLRSGRADRHVVTKFDFCANTYPTEPGCYLLKDSGGRVLYVGKAKNLRRRLAAYFRRRRKAARTRRLVARVAGVEVILVANETESLVLENNLIKLYQPPYNRHLRAKDSGYYYIALTAEEISRFVPYRRNRINRDLEQTGNGAVARLFGPYVTRRFRDLLLQFVCQHYRLRTCRSIPGHICFTYHLGRCTGICEARITRAAYDEAVAQAVAFLEHKNGDVIAAMRRRMQEYAERLEFERAQWLRDRIEALERTLVKQNVERDVACNQDVIYFGERHALVTEVRHGAVQRLHLCPLEQGQAYARMCQQFLIAHYDGQRNGKTPDELIVNRLDNLAAVERRLVGRCGRAIRIKLPRSRPERELLKFCERNYAYRVSAQM